MTFYWPVEAPAFSLTPTTAVEQYKLFVYPQGKVGPGQHTKLSFWSSQERADIPPELHTSPVLGNLSAVIGAQLWEEGSKHRQSVGYFEQPPSLAGLSKPGQTQGTCKWALEHREHCFIAGDLQTAPEGSLKFNRENGQQAEMGSTGVQAGAGMFTGFLQVWHAGRGSLRKKICSCSAGSEPICGHKELVFAAGE